ncbi:SusC/RagA family TonB-linked outer membrane protein [Panacibacter sp. DH6]|uniref:SusC/RagA family TonB-linked outer membrane protein n=1 Tax=Panacibacter microcysteis TaxID=2793269 RepID=A0A931E2U5_9BACT|nr:SusC/RagA family TonB-linked outer membrane protein [Panacibacter microcysteis]MBG9376053.1 SusC/RagA family TonB-linked outer membrane protein [Panacibacter microcysteis]
MNVTKLLRLPVFTLVLSLIIGIAHAQSRTVTGKVVSATGTPLEAASVMIKGTSMGTTTNREGVFSINVPAANNTLVVSVIGYQQLEVDIANQTNIEIKLTESNDKLTDVVVVGYGTQKKKEITSAVTSVKAEQFNRGNVPNVSQLLQGKVAGLSIARPGGDPNAGFAIRLRGLSTLGANASPLVVVDGQIGIDINTVDPNDIQSIDVLKDAASAAIYGTRGSAGVIIITTKRGARGAASIAYNGTLSSETPAKFTDHMSADEYVAAGGSDLGSKTDWNKEITRTAISHTHNLSISGGNNGTSYTASVNYRNNQGVAITTGFSQFNVHFGLTQRALKDKLALTLDANNTKRNSDFGWSDAFKYATIFNPTAPVKSADPAYDLTGGGYFEQNFVDYSNPVAVLEQNTNKRVTKRNNINASATYEFIKGLKGSVRYAQENISYYNWAYLPKTSFYVRSFLGVSGFARNGYAWKRDDESFNQLYENTLSYDGKINNLSISAVGGYSYQDFLYNGFYVQAGNFLTDAVSEDFNSSLDFKNGLAYSDSYKNGSKLVAFFGRVNLNYNDIAFLSASLRREGSTQFGANNKWGMFPAVSVGLDVNKFLQVSAINNFKLRASYGVTGALPPRSYLSQLLYGPAGGSDRLFYANGVYSPSYAPTQNANEDLKWEKKAEFDVGADFAAFGNRLTGTVDYYNRNTSDLIFNVTVPVPPYPTSTQFRNIGTLKSSGVELMVAYDIIKNKDFTWNSSVNFSTYSVKLASLNKDLAGSFVGASNLGTPGQEQTQITRAVEGEKIGLLWGPVYKGIDKDGQYLFDDGTGKDTNSTFYKTIIGYGLPKFEFGVTNTFRYKNFDLNFFFRGSIGHDLINTFRAFYENATVVNSYNVVNTKYYNPDLKDAQEYSSLHVERASFVKLDNATIGYNFQMKKTGTVKGVRAFVTGQNLFVITDYTGVDPEVRYDDGGNILAPGIDRREIWVRTRTFSLGVNIQF